VITGRGGEDFFGHHQRHDQRGRNLLLHHPGDGLGWQHRQPGFLDHNQRSSGRRRSVHISEL